MVTKKGGKTEIVGKEIGFRNGKTIIEAGDHPKCFYFIKRGRAARQRFDPKTKIIATMPSQEKGSLIGFVEALLGHKHHFTHFADGDCLLIAFPAEEAWEFLEQDNIKFFIALFSKLAAEMMVVEEHYLESLGVAETKEREISMLRKKLSDQQRETSTLDDLLGTLAGVRIVRQNNG